MRWKARLLVDKMDLEVQQGLLANVRRVHDQKGNSTSRDTVKTRNATLAN